MTGHDYAFSSVRQQIHKETHLSLMDWLPRQQGVGHLESSNRHQIKRRVGGERGNLVKMLDDLGQHLTPEITDWSAAST